MSVRRTDRAEEEDEDLHYRHVESCCCVVTRSVGLGRRDERVGGGRGALKWAGSRSIERVAIESHGSVDYILDRKLRELLTS